MITNRIKIRAGLKQRQFCSNKSFDIRELKQQRRATAAKTSLKKWSRAASNFIALIPFRSIRQMLAIFFWTWILKDGIEV